MASEDDDEVEEEDGRGGDEEVLRLPGFVFRRKPQLLHYAATLHRPSTHTRAIADTHTHRSHRGELTLLSKTGGHIHTQ